MKILIVDDDPNITNLLPIILANEGFQNVQCFLSAVEGFAALKEPHSSYDCLMLDINMPEMNGIEFCRKARSLSNYRNVPIIMLTALRDEAIVREAISAGATDYITKPFDVLEIGVRVKMSSNLVQAQRALNYIRDRGGEQEYQSKDSKPNVTRSEIMNIFADDLYHSKKG